ncbi:hypothetical protein KCP70_02750 [Salmonella enterica subsp. enterica]|nr:hypothetical protein KCP70_02750 [Salmonella enterica subsp. enterica]
MRCGGCRRSKVMIGIGSPRASIEDSALRRAVGAENFYTGIAAASRTSRFGG